MAEKDNDLHQNSSQFSPSSDTEQTNSIGDQQATLSPPTLQLKSSGKSEQMMTHSAFEPIADEHMFAKNTSEPPEDSPAQKASEESGPLQAKFDPIQRQGDLEEEDLMQGKFAPVQRQSELDEEEALQGKFATVQRKEEGLEEEMQMKKAPSSSAPVQRQEDNTSGVIGKMGQSMGADFSGVNIHANSPKAPEVGALAYTQGNDIHFAPGQFKPDTQSGQELLGHELAHVKQQSEGRVKPTTEVNGMPVNDDHSLESEADNMGKIAAQAKFEDMD